MKDFLDTIAGAAFFAMCAVAGFTLCIVCRWFPYLLGLVLVWAIAEHQEWVNLVEFM